MFQNRLVGNVLYYLNIFHDVFIPKYLSWFSSFLLKWSQCISCIWRWNFAYYIHICKDIVFQPIKFIRTGISKSVHDGNSDHKKSTGLHGSTAHRSWINKGLNPFKWCANNVPFTKRSGARKQRVSREIRDGKCCLSLGESWIDYWKLKRCLDNVL